MNTTLSAASGGLVTFLLVLGLDKVENVGSLSNGLLAGLVGITAGCDAANAAWALGIGAVSGALFVASAKLLQRLRVDDPLDAFSVHGVNGFWGVVASGLVRVHVGGADASVLSGCITGAFVIAGWALLCSFVI